MILDDYPILSYMIVGVFDDYRYIVMVCYAILLHIYIYYVMLCDIMLYYVMLYYIMLYCTMLYIRFCITRGLWTLIRPDSP